MDSEKKVQIQNDAHEHYEAAYTYNACRARLWIDALRAEDIPYELIEKLVLQWYAAVTQIDVQLALNGIEASKVIHEGTKRE